MALPPATTPNYVNRHIEANLLDPKRQIFSVAPMMDGIEKQDYPVSWLNARAVCVQR
jgi:hypothetical protein